MIKDWRKYESYRIKLLNKFRYQFNNLEDSVLYDLFQEAYIDKFAVFEEKYDTERGTEFAFLYRLVRNRFITLLGKEKKTFSVVGTIPDSIEFEDYDDDSEVKFPQILFGVINKHAEFSDDELEIDKILSKRFKTVSPLVKMEAWSNKRKLSASVLEIMTKKFISDMESAEFYDWKEPTPVIRLQSWTGCS